MIVRNETHFHFDGKIVAFKIQKNQGAYFRLEAFSDHSSSKIQLVRQR